MASRPNLPNIKDVASDIKKEKFRPLYFLCGEDTHAIDSAAKVLAEKAGPQLASEFDRETFSMEKGVNVNDIFDTALAFPFGEGKKFIVIKNFEKAQDKKSLAQYAASPADFTIMVVLYYGKVGSLASEPFKTLAANGYLFNAPRLTGAGLTDWIVKTAMRKGAKITSENARVLSDIVGEDKGLLESQLIKLADYSGKGEEISLESIKRMTSNTKEYSIFDLQDAIGAGDKKKSLEVGLKLIDSGMDMVRMNAQLAKFVMTVGLAWEMKRKNTPVREGSREAGVSEYYFKKCSQSRYLMNPNKLLNVSRRLLEADILSKSSSVDQKTMFVTLLSGIFEDA